MSQSPGVPLLELVSALAPPLCWGCGRTASARDPLCFACRRELRWLDAPSAADGDPPVWAPLAYDGAAAALVRALKFRGAAGLVELMAGQIAANAPVGVLGDAAATVDAPGARGVPPGRPGQGVTGGGTPAPRPRLVPVPLHPARLRRRGFNQAERLAAALARRTGLQVDDCLARGGGRGTQMGRARAERATSLTGAVTALRRSPRRAVLVDDVTTTGATFAACAHALREAGAREVSAVAYARTPGR